MKRIFGPGHNPSLCHQQFVGYSEVEYNVMPIKRKEFFRRKLVHHFGYSKVAAYSEANSRSEEFTSNKVKWSFLSVGPLARLTFLTQYVPLAPLKQVFSPAHGI